MLPRIGLYKDRVILDFFFRIASHFNQNVDSYYPNRMGVADLWHLRENIAPCGPAIKTCGKDGLDNNQLDRRFQAAIAKNAPEDPHAVT